MFDETIQQLNRFITTDILKQPGRQLSPAEKLNSSGLIDSFSKVDLAIFIENTFGVHLDDTELDTNTFDTLADLAALIHSRQA